jgi:hypothetical protein
MSLPDTRPVIVASHPRSGTHLLIDLLRRHFEACNGWKWWGERLDRLYCSIDELNADRGRLDASTARRILQRTERPIVKTHAWPSLDDTFLNEHHDGLPEEWVNWLRNRGTFLYVVRDVRDVMASYQMFRGWFDHENERLGRFIRGADAPEKPNRIVNWARHVRAWQETPGVHVIRFEDVLGKPDYVLQRVAGMLNLELNPTSPLLPKRFSSIWHSRFARFFSTRPRSTAILGTGAQDRQNKMTPSDYAFIHEHTGHLLRELGYADAEDGFESD